MSLVIQAVLFVGFPVAAQWGARKYKALRFLGPIVLCYLFGIALGNLVFMNTELATTFTEATVLLAIPLLLFTTDFRAWLRIARPAVISFTLAAVAVIITAATATLILAGPHDWQMAGMTVGVYTGGTPNMSAIGIALGVPDETFVLLNGADVILSGVYLLFLLSIAQRVLGKFLPAFDYSRLGDDFDDGTRNDFGWRHVLAAVGLSILSSGVAVGIVYLFVPDLPIAAVILAITTVGILASFAPKIRNFPGTFETGEFLLLVFAVAVGTLANVRRLVGAFGEVFLFVAIVLIGAILLHYLLATFFRIDTDTVLITSTAAVFGPAFVPPVAAALKNRQVLVSGLTTGVVGYAIGNYAGIALAYLLRPG
ncbi:hypothetical protein BMS3Abin02_01776 [bacterium BMS3Abin02]|nr:hypothetical protein BMS3Abin02_01776 [bacterium BMS3Abin02]GBE22536.1 hypothetical protein BMS3Bbin01_01911 [bacterium BMS3Bbin01]HDH24644.1 DUF819 family protein [Actinomycetota bacterium]HDL50062.1 DUF819 family protein [Actinomycetota bacterium]